RDRPSRKRRLFFHSHPFRCRRPRTGLPTRTLVVGGALTAPWLHKLQRARQRPGKPGSESRSACTWQTCDLSTRPGRCYSRRCNRRREMATPLSRDLLHRMDAYWRAANYLSVGQIYLYDNPLLRTPLGLAHLKPRLLGHWGTTPGQNFIYVHLKDRKSTRLNSSHGSNSYAVFCF